jgi:hypothetical protein
VRVQIACREVTKVPAVAEGTFGLMIYDFSFEREMEAAEGNKMEKIPTKNHDLGGLQVQKDLEWKLQEMLRKKSKMKEKNQFKVVGEV